MASELLSIEHIRNHDTSAALTLLDGIVREANDPGSVRRALLRSVFLRFCLMSDYDAALDRYLVLEARYPGSPEAVYAKILLRMDPDSTEWAGIRKQQRETGERVQAENTLPGWLEIADIRPNPFSESASVDVLTRQPETVGLLMYDIHGRLIRMESGLQLKSGMNTVIVRRKGLPPGLYLLTFRSAEKRVSRRILVSD
jgi:hypothetical protein